MNWLAAPHREEVNIEAIRFAIKDLGLEKEKRRELTREEETEGERRPGGAERGVDERKAEALAVDMSDLENEPRQAIAAA